MIAQAFRFRGHNSVDKVYRRSQTLRGSLLNLKFTVEPGRRPYKAAVVVSRKVSKSAVVRNRIRRRIYEIIRQFNGDQDQLASRQLVFIVYSDQLASLESDRLRAAVCDLLKRAITGNESTVSSTGHGIVKATSNATGRPKDKQGER
jgi:ribonuclease P protein component